MDMNHSSICEEIEEIPSHGVARHTTSRSRLVNWLFTVSFWLSLHVLVSFAANGHNMDEYSGGMRHFYFGRDLDSWHPFPGPRITVPYARAPLG